MPWRSFLCVPLAAYQYESLLRRQTGEVSTVAECDVAPFAAATAVLLLLVIFVMTRFFASEGDEPYVSWMTPGEG